jgi:3-hydroxyisobutyrate dehydrogenase-like beta-hydroxyacid dehydrogenase
VSHHVTGDEGLEGEESVETVGVIGVGAMGSAFVERFRAAGLRTLVYDVSPVAMERAAALGAEPCPSPAAVGKAADVVDVMVRTDRQMLDCTLGEGGVLQGLTAGKVLLLHSTVHPRTTRTVAAAAQSRGIEVADACIGGIPEVVRAGEADILLGAEPALEARIRPHLLRLGKAVYHMGPVGCGNVAKLMKNLVVVPQSLIIGEALRIGEASGIPYQRGLAMLKQMPSAFERPDEAFDPRDPRSAQGGQRNLFEQVLPPVSALADEYELDVRLLRLLAAGCQPRSEAVAEAAPAGLAGMNGHATAVGTGRVRPRRAARGSSGSN